MTSLRDWISENIPDVIMDDAAAWMALLDSERCTAADRLAFARWLDEDSRHRWAFEELSEVWARLRTLTEVAPLLEQPQVTRLPVPAAALKAMHEGDRPRSDWSALAVSLIVIAGIAAHFLTSATTHTYTTRPGEMAEVELEDGSRIELNALTSLEVVYGARRRDIRLLNGEALFHVAKDQRPFVVSADGASVSALGTSFVVEKNIDSLEVAVLEGAVTVKPANRDSPLSEYDMQHSSWTEGEPLQLVAGDQVVLSPDAVRFEQTSDELLARMLSWRDGVVEFDDQPLSTVVSEMRQYADINVHIADSKTGNTRISGRFEAGDTDAYVAYLDKIDDVSVDHAGANWIVLRTRRGGFEE